jgi:hypothetical protein
MATFKADLTTDIDNVFFNSLEFTEEATLTTVIDGASTIDVYFDERFENFIYGDNEVQGSLLEVMVKESDIVNATVNDTITIRTVVYKIKELQRSGSGTAILTIGVDIIT